MKVLIYGLTSNFGGVERYIFDRIPYISKKNHIDLVYTKGSMIDYLDVLKTGGLGVKYIDKLLNPIKYFLSLRRLLTLEKYECVYCNLPFSNCLLYIAVKLSGARLIVHAHNTRIDHESYLKRTLMYFYHVISKTFFSWMIDKEYGCSQLSCIWLFGKYNFSMLRKNAIDCDKFCYDIQIRKTKRMELNIKDEYIVGHIGRFSFQKNHEFLIKVFNEIQIMMPNTKLMLIGNGPKLNVEKTLVDKLNIKEKVLFLGLRTDVSELMQAMDCFLLPSRFEGLPIVGIEAQAADLPCFFSNTISKELKIINAVEYISLEDSPKEWAIKILKSREYKRNNVKGILIENGYDLGREMDNAPNFFE